MSDNKTLDTRVSEDMKKKINELMMQLGVYDELFSIFDELIILPKDSFKLNCRKPDGNIIHCIVAFISFPIWYLMFLFLSILGASLIIISSDRKPIILPKGFLS